MKKRERALDALEVIMLISFIAGICCAEAVLCLIGCWGITFGAYLIYRGIV